MPYAFFEEMKSYLQFDERDAERIRTLAPHLAAIAPQVVERFYTEILQQDGARRLLTDEAQLRRLKGTLENWITDLSRGSYDDEYCQRRYQIGRVHVRVGLPQHYMFAAMEVIWQEFRRLLPPRVGADAADQLHALHKLLTLETGIMLESYREQYSEQVRKNEREAVHERLSRAEHLAEIGKLAASLAHEIKNPLAGISGAIQVIRDTLASDDDRRPVLAEVLRQINRLDGTVKDLLVYARPRPVKLVRCDLERIMERILTVLRREPEAQRIRIECENRIRMPVYADEIQIEQLIMNLLLNAAHATGEGGHIRVRGRADRAACHLEIEDNGHGMDDETARRAFEPFFTTKARGTGLGLSICQKIVENHGGTIRLRSTPGQGTTVLIDIPHVSLPTEDERTDEHSCSYR